MKSLSIPLEGVSESELEEIINNKASRDITFDSGRIFNTECCSPHPFALKAYQKLMDRNMMKEQNPSVNEMEQEIILMLTSLFDGQDCSGLNGYVSSGGTESNIMAFWAASKMYPNRDTVIAPRHAHYSKKKLSMLLGLNVIELPVTSDFRVDPEEIERHITDRTLGIFATAGTSRLGVIDPIDDLSRIARKYGIHLHIDAAYGGYLIPFLKGTKYELPDIGFSTGADSITLDPHKYGMCPLGAGVILFKTKHYNDQISYVADFPKINNRTFQGSRSGGPVAATWAMLMHYGFNGYMKSAEELMAKRD
jgi:tyrosine decarboxylase / aspartate 1-decarboxylase